MHIMHDMTTQTRLINDNGEIKKISLVFCRSELVCKSHETVYKRHTIMGNLYKGRVWFNKNVYLISMSLFVPTWGAKCNDTAHSKKGYTKHGIQYATEVLKQDVIRYMCTETWMTMKCMMTSRAENVHCQHHPGWMLCNLYEINRCRSLQNAPVCITFYYCHMLVCVNFAGHLTYPILFHFYIAFRSRLTRQRCAKLPSQYNVSFCCQPACSCAGNAIFSELWWWFVINRSIQSKGQHPW